MGIFAGKPARQSADFGKSIANFNRKLRKLTQYFEKVEVGGGTCCGSPSLRSRTTSASGTNVGGVTPGRVEVWPSQP